MSDVGLADLFRALRMLCRTFDLDSASGARRLPDGAVVKLTVYRGGAATIERDDGQAVMLDDVEAWAE